MANFIVASTFMNYTVIQATTELGSTFSKENIELIDQPFVVWKGVTNNPHTLTIDMGAFFSDIKIYINNVNFPSLTIQAHDTDTWGSPNFNQSVTVNKNLFHQRRMGYWDLKDLASFSNLRYIRLSIPNQTTDDGDSFRVGAVALMSSVTELERNPFRFDMITRTPKIFSRDTDSDAVLEQAVTAPNYVVFTADFQVGRDIDRSDTVTLYNNVVHPDFFLLYVNNGFPEEAYMLKRTSTIRRTLSNNPATEVREQGFILEEVIF